MKTFLLDALNKIRRFDESLDIKTVLCNKPWVAFDDDLSRHSYIFKEDGGLVITTQGKGRETTWEYLPANKTVKFKDADGVVELYHPTVFDGNLLVLNLDTTDEYAILLNENAVFKPQKLEDIIVYLKQFDKKSEGPYYIKATSSVPVKPDTRPAIHFAEDIFTPAERDGEKFYVNRENRYAFSSVEHEFAKAILVKDREDKYLFFFNDSLENVHSSYDKPLWNEYWDGLVLDGIQLKISSNRFLFYQEKWYKCVPVREGYYKIEGEEGIVFFQDDRERLIKVQESDIKDLNDADTGFIIGLSIVAVLFFIVIIVAIAS